MDDQSLPGSSQTPADLLIGSLLVLQPREGVFVGGLLVTTHRGRPVEFHCTAPLTPNPTQRLLYGNTLTPYVCGEVIGGALMKKAATSPHLLLLASGDALDVRTVSKCPAAVVLDDGRDPVGESLSDAAAGDRAFTLGPLTLEVHADYGEDVGQIHGLGLDLDADLTEPLERVREALGQTLRADAA